jgi:mevalonate pyrophosphate decarboxylase
MKKQKSTFKQFKENDTLYFNGYQEPKNKFAKIFKELKK